MEIRIITPKYEHALRIEEYIAGGAIEAYVLGMCTPGERKEFEKLCKEYPELQAAREEFERTLEEQAFANAIDPPPKLKETVLEMIQQEEQDTGTRAAEKSIVKELRPMRWAIAISAALFIATCWFIYFLYQKNNELNSMIVTSRQQIELIDQQHEALEKSATSRQVNVSLPKQTVPASVKVYWDSTSAHVYLVIRDLARLAPGEKYQLWSINDGKHTSLGLFDAPVNDKLILKLNNAQRSEAFAISIAKENNSPVVPSN